MQFLPQIFDSLNLDRDPDASYEQVKNVQHLKSCFDVSGLAASSYLALGEALKSLLSQQFPALTPTLEVDQRLASLWFGASLHLDEGENPAGWDPIAGDYQSVSGWIRLHTNAPHHKAAALRVLNVPEDRDLVATAVRKWNGTDLENAIVCAGGCAAQMRSLEDWREHPQGRAVQQEPLVGWSFGQDTVQPNFSVRNPERPLEGLKVLDLTRVIAGPVATRALAGFGAQVLRVDPERWQEPGLFEELTIGKRCTKLDLKDAVDKAGFEQLVGEADLLIHGLRGDALAGLGFSVPDLRRINPALIDVAHNAYGWTGPWANRRGFDSLVQMSSGIADFGMKSTQSLKPHPLPVQALDHATGYLVAAAAIMAIKHAKRESCAVSARTSLARVSALLSPTASSGEIEDFVPLCQNDFTSVVERTHLGDAYRLKPAISLTGIPHHWQSKACALRSSLPSWKRG